MEQGQRERAHSGEPALDDSQGQAHELPEESVHHQDYRSSLRRLLRELFSQPDLHVFDRSHQEVCAPQPVLQTDRVTTRFSGANPRLEFALNLVYGIKYLKFNIKKFKTPWKAILSKRSGLIDIEDTKK